VEQDLNQPDPKDVERRKNELLAEARGESKEGQPNAMMGAGLQFVVTTLVCLFVGQWLDGKFGTRPWLMIAGMMVGGGLGFWSLIRVAKAANDEADRKARGGK
jgi:F0F1-type ATP synthase assembly protein I